MSSKRNLSWSWRTWKIGSISRVCELNSNNILRLRGSSNFRVQTVMLHLVGRALDWPHFYTQRQRGFHMLVWETYGQSFWERFALSYFQDPMSNLVSLKQQGSMDQYHDTFISLLNQLQLPESYALSILPATSEIGKHLTVVQAENFDGRISGGRPSGGNITTIS